MRGRDYIGVENCSSPCVAGSRSILPPVAGGGWEGGCELLDVVDHILPEEGQHWVSPTFICTIASGEPRILEPAKCSEIGWFHPDEVPGDLTQITRQNLAHYLRRRVSEQQNPYRGHRVGGQGG